MSNDIPKNFEAYKAILEIDEQKQRSKEKQEVWKAYILSICVPPIGIYYFIKYFLFVEVENARKSAVMSLILTGISLFVSFWLVQALFNQSMSNSNNNLNFMRELITPENQKTLQELLR